MRKKRLVVISVLVLLWSCSLADSRVVILDPNADGAITAKMYSQTDTGLAKKVTYEAKFRSVKQVLDDLREMSGVALVAGTGKSDWPVRSRKMNICVKDVPLSDIMDSIARVMKFRWSRYDNIKPMVYRLKIDKKAAATADKMMKDAANKEAQAWSGWRQEWADLMAKYGDKSKEELHYLRETDPETYEMAQLGCLQAIAALFKEIPETKERYIQGRSFRISSDKLTPATKNLLFNAADEFCKHLQRGGFAGPRTTNPSGLDSSLTLGDKFDMVYIRLDVDTFTPGHRWGNMGKGTGYFNVMKGSRDFEINEFRYRDPILGPKSAFSNILINEGVKPEEAWKDHRDQAAPAFWQKKQEQLEAMYSPEPLTEHKSSPELDKTVTIKIDKSEFDKDRDMLLNNITFQVQKSISDLTGLGVVSDAWANPVLLKGRLDLPEKDAKLIELLDRFCSGLNYNWDNRNSILEFRQRSWAQMRLNQIPDEWVARWSENTAKTGCLSIDDLAQIANLTYEQAEESLKPDPVVGNRGTYRKMLEVLDYNGSIIWFWLYSMLTPQQRNLLQGDRGLNGFMLTSDQWKTASRMFDRIGTTRGDVIMHLTSTKEKARLEARDLDSGEVDRVWDVELPQYTPPQPDHKP